LIDSGRAVTSSADAPEEDAGSAHQGCDAAFGQPFGSPVAVRKSEEVIAPIHDATMGTIVRLSQGTIVLAHERKCLGTLVLMQLSEFVSRVDERRQELGLSERALLIEAGLDLSTIRRVRSRGQTPGAPHIAKLERALRLPENSLMRLITGGSSTAPQEDAHLLRGIGDRLRQAREALGLSPEQFCEIHRIDLLALRDMEEGRAYPEPQFIRSLWKNSRVNADWIFLGEIFGLPQILAGNLRAAERVSEADPPEA
jgi:transcriptional regulator with XRE-family HTH domain